MQNIEICSVFVLNDHNQVLAVKQEYELMNGYAWTLPGGGVDEGETPEQAARREVTEETGYHVTGVPQKVYESIVQLQDVRLVVHGFLYHGYDGVATISEDEIVEIRFMPLDEACKEMCLVPDEARVEPIIQTLQKIQNAEDMTCSHYHYVVDSDRQIVSRLQP